MDKHEVCLYQAIHQEADQVVENVDAIRAMIAEMKDVETLIAIANKILRFTAI